MSKMAVKKSKSVKRATPVRQTKTSLGLRIMTNEDRTGQRGRPVMSEDRMSLSKNGLNFNDRTRKHLNIPPQCYFQFMMNDESDKSGVFYATIHKDLRSRHSMKLKKTAVTYYRVLLPTSASEMKLLKSKEKLTFKCDRVKEGNKTSFLRLSLIKK